ncbi:MAG: DNA recombination protein RmuC [Actinobacteria bacterium]|nr:DNA recombination protein RmuC [Actinomycetota bacterium]
MDITLVVVIAVAAVLLVAAVVAGVVVGTRMGRSGGEPATPAVPVSPASPAGPSAEELARRAADEGTRHALEQFLAQHREMTDQAMTHQQQVMARERQMVVGELDRRKELIDRQLGEVAQAVRTVGETVHRLEADRKVAFGGLERELRMLHETHESLRTETGNLVTALRNPSTRGRWGEMQLRRAVEMAGMVRHCDFVEQATVDGDDGRLRPDVVVRLPGAKSAVIDAKVPLHAYLEAVEAADDAAQVVKLRDHARQVRTHIDTLASKAYWSQFPDAPDFVVMFVPGDQLLAAAFEHEPALMEHAVANRVLIATPVTLIALLRSIAYGWQQESLAENARQIADAGRVLHERLGTFSTHLRKVGTNLDRAVGAFNEAVGSYDARVMPAARKLSELDVAETEVPGVAAVERRSRPVSTGDPEAAPRREHGGAVIDLTAPDGAAPVEGPATLALEA